MKDYYAILDVPPSASLETIRDQYLFLIQAWHPDKFPKPTQKVKAEEKSKDINEAYNILKNPQKRAAYDRQRLGQSAWSSQEEYRRRAEEQRKREAEELRRRQDDEKRRREVQEQKRQEAQELRRRQDEEKRRRQSEAQGQRETAGKQRHTQGEQQGAQEKEKKRQIDYEAEKHNEAEAYKSVRQLVEYAQAQRKRKEHHPPQENRTAQNPIRVLIVEHIEYQRDRIRELISRGPDIMVCGEASSGREAIIQFNTLKPDVVTMDMGMLDMNGITATKIIRRENPDARIIMVTILNNVNYIRESMLAGACNYIFDPWAILFEEEELLSAIRQAIC